MNDASSNCREIETADPKKTKSWNKAVLAAVAVIPTGLTLASLTLAHFANKMMEAQNRLSATAIAHGQAQHRQSTESYRAQVMYEEIRDVLNNPEAPIQAQIFALRMFPEAMRASVDEVTRGRIKRFYPNAQPLRTLLLQYLRTSRGPYGSMPSLETAPIGYELVQLLHKLGPPEKGKPEVCLWKLPESSNEEDSKAWRRIRENPKTRPLEFDLSHLKPTDFAGLCAPYLFHSFVEAAIIFPDDADFGGANLFGANFARCTLRNATFRACNLEKAILVGVKEQGADFTGAITKDAKFE